MTLSRLSYVLSAAYFIGNVLGYRQGKRHGHTLGYIAGVRDIARARIR